MTAGSYITQYSEDLYIPVLQLQMYSLDRISIQHNLIICVLGLICPISHFRRDTVVPAALSQKELERIVLDESFSNEETNDMSNV